MRQSNSLTNGLPDGMEANTGAAATGGCPAQEPGHLRPRPRLSNKRMQENLLPLPNAQHSALI